MHVLIVEDDQELSDLIARVLDDEGYTSAIAATLAQGRALLVSSSFDVIVLDWMLPDEDGIKLCEELRRASTAPPVLMLTARGALEDRVKGLRSGADDYLTKPFEIEELLARLDALARRSQRDLEIKVGLLTISRLSRRAFLDGVALDLRAKELDLLIRLAQSLDVPVSRAELLNDVWGLSFDPGSGVLDVHISRLRDRLGENAWQLETVRGVGYRLRRSR